MKKLDMNISAPESWKIEWTLKSGACGELIALCAGEQPVLTVSRDENLLTAVLHTVWHCDTPRHGKDPHFTFTLTSPVTSGKIALVWRGYSFRLYVDGVLKDEEWPLGTPCESEWTACVANCVSEFSVGAADPWTSDPEQSYDAPFQNFVLPGHNTGVGDCMPFARDGRYCLYYLFDRRAHCSKQGLGAHQWAQISSDDLKHWTIHPMAVGITEQWEGSICTGSLIQKDGKTYAFYAVRTSDGTPAQLTWAVSPDGVHFEKSDKTFALTAPYEPVSARDPMVFCDRDGLYHMLVTTSLVDEGMFGGCLAHLTSPDLMSWTQHEPFIVPGYRDQPECSDYFEWNGWYYLVFSNFATARYRMSRNPFGPWVRPEVDELDAIEVQVPKTAVFGDRRFSTGFLARRPRTYAGNAITHELFQREDGTLGIRQLEEILPEGKALACPEIGKIEAGQNRAAAKVPVASQNFRLKATLTPENRRMLMGLVLKFGEDDRHTYRIDMVPAAGTVHIIRPEGSFIYGESRDKLYNVSGLDQSISVDLIVRGDILDLIFSNGRAMTMRLDEQVRPEGVRVDFYAQAGTLAVSDLALEAYSC